MPTALSTLAGAQVPLWISGTTYPQYFVVRSPADQQLYLRRTNGAGTTDPASDSTNWQPEGARPVKSRQIAYVSFQGTTGTATISAVNTAKCHLENIGAKIAPGGGSFETCMPVLTNSTTLTVTRDATNSTVVSSVGIQITEYY
ncbi:hypothetical protein PSQ39_06580 [Curvibacter sp. HBC28]|uniref:Uncharacterized protein n=1 Tax=Curvibacter microcysteis TaxID=3026419 RepID=A0ABT5MEH0_9BURK|nr:hypothetical protein [Curvibacter sp. HBC28]MDD0814292.1 hypothetical protein [Curvibacter sp. HBC28]